MKVYFEKSKQVVADLGDFVVKTDQPVEGGGDNEFPAPFSLFLASLGTCAGIFIKGFCDQRQLDASQITIDQDMAYNPAKGYIDKFQMIINVPAEFPEKYYSALIRSAEQCAVKRHLKDDIELITKVEKIK